MKKFIIGFFLLLIIATMVFFSVVAYDSWSYDMDPENGVDLLEGFGAMMAVAIGGTFVWYELDLMCTLCYFFGSGKTVLKTLINILASLSFTMAFLYGWLSNSYMQLRAYEGALIILMVIYIVLRIIHIGLWACTLETEEV